MFHHREHPLSLTDFARRPDRTWRIEGEGYEPNHCGLTRRARTEIDLFLALRRTQQERLAVMIHAPALVEQCVLVRIELRAGADQRLHKCAFPCKRMPWEQKRHALVCHDASVDKDQVGRVVSNETAHLGTEHPDRQIKIGARAFVAIPVLDAVCAAVAQYSETPRNARGGHNVVAHSPAARKACEDDSKDLRVRGADGEPGTVRLNHRCVVRILIFDPQSPGIVAGRPPGIIGSMGTLSLAARSLLALVFAVAAGTKLPNPSASRATFREFGVGETMARLSLFLAPTELAVAVTLMIRPTARWAAVAATALVLAFIAGMAHALRLGRRPNCGCFGGLRPAPIGRSTLLRNVALLVFCLFVVAAGPGPAIGAWFQSNSATEIGLTAAVTLAAAAIVMTPFSATAKHHDSVQLASISTTPAAGSLAPQFTAIDSGGEPCSLGQLLAKGRPVVLIFGSPGCGSCEKLFVHLARWQSTLVESLHIAVVGSGKPEQVRVLHERYRIEGVISDDNGEISRAYGVRITPTAFSVATDGRIMSGPALGPDAIEDLVRLTIHHAEPMLGPWSSTIPAA